MTSDEYPFSGDRTLMEQIEENPVGVWSTTTGSTILNYTDSVDDNIEGYVSAEDDHTPHYLNVLESPMDCLAELTLDSSKMEPVDNIQFDPPEVGESVVELDGQQVVVYSMEGSDDLFGMQLTHDEDGNLQKYQFKFRTNELGQLEAIPESIQLVDNDFSIENETLVHQNMENLELIDDENTLIVNQYEEVESELSPLTVKNEILTADEEFDTQDNEYLDENIQYEDVVDEFTSHPMSDNIYITSTADIKQEQVQKNQYDDIYIEENHLVDEDVGQELLLQAQTENYEIVEGIQITSEDQVDEIEHEDEPYDENEGEEDDEHTTTITIEQPEPVLQEVVEKADISDKENINKQNNVVFYVQLQPPEKENLYNGNIKVNPRSILKSSFSTVQMKKEVKIDEKTLKRFSRNKHIVQARQFHNFINKTTIPNAPVRLQRQPRKQTIKPVDHRADEEIIVQQVMVSASGYVDTVSRRPTKTVDIIELTDSDDEHCNNTSRKKKKSISDDDTSDSEASSVIEVFSDEEYTTRRSYNNKSSSAAQGTMNPKRGRPRISDLNGKKVFKCPHCTSTFPSENSLNTHKQHHNLENQLRRSKFEYGHKCSTCKEIFKNRVLLSRHVCAKKSVSCTICKAEFKTTELLNIHRRTHMKQTVVSATNRVSISPRKLGKIKKAPEQKRFQCKLCQRLYRLQPDLIRHEKVHVKFECKSCTQVFPSRMLLDLHTRNGCVKMKSPGRMGSGRKSQVPSVPVIFQQQCKECTMVFPSFTSLFKHRVRIHNLSTPNDSIRNPKPKVKRLHSPIAPHSGVPANPRVRAIYRTIRQRLLDVPEDEDEDE